MMRILTLNLCASHSRPRATRMAEVADAVRGLGIDVVLAQEGVRSCWVYDTLRGLAADLRYDYTARTSFGWPFAWEFRVGVLSRWPILSEHAGDIEVPQKEWLDGLWVPCRARAVGAVVQVPDLGPAAIVSVHLASSPKTQGDRNEQFLKLVRFMGDLPKTEVSVIGGDFNAPDRNEAFLPLTRCGYRITGHNPDYLCVDGALVHKSYPVFTDLQVSDHAGYVVEVS